MLGIWGEGEDFCSVVYSDLYGGLVYWSSCLVLEHLTAVSVQAEAKLPCVNEVRHQCKLSWGSDAALAEKTLAVKCCDEQQTFPVHKSPSLS